MQVLLLGAEIKKRFCVDHLMNDDDQNKDAGSNQKKLKKKKRYHDEHIIYKGNRREFGKGKAGPKRRSQYFNPRLNTQAISAVIHYISS